MSEPETVPGALADAVTPAAATQDAGVEAVDTPDVVPESFGARLAWERTRAGLTVNDIAARLRLHPKQVHAIEREQLASLPAAAYVRGFIRGYARIVNADPVPLLADFSTRLAAVGAQPDGAGHANNPALAATAESHGWRYVVVAAAVLLLAGLAAIGWYSGVRTPAQPVSPTVTKPAVPAHSAPVPNPGTASDSQAVATAAATLAPSAGSAPGAEPATTGETAPAAKVPVEVAAVAQGPTALLLLEFSGPSWVQVTAADGRVLLSEHGTDGMVRRLGGPVPLSVVLGDAQNVRVKVRGEDFDLRAISRQNVARFSVN